MKGKRRRKEEEEEEGAHRMMQLPRDYGLCIRHSRDWGPAIADQIVRWKQSVMSPPSGRQQNSWSGDKLLQCNTEYNRKSEANISNMPEITWCNLDHISPDICKE